MILYVTHSFLVKKIAEKIATDYSTLKLRLKYNVVIFYENKGCKSEVSNAMKRYKNIVDEFYWNFNIDSGIQEWRSFMF